MTDDFKAIYQNRILNDLARLDSSGSEIDYDGKSKLIGEYITARTEQWTPVYMKVLDAAMLKAAESTADSIYISVNEYAELCRIKYDTARKQINSAIPVLDSLKITQTDAPICHCERIHNGMILDLTDSFIYELRGKESMGVMPFPLRLFQINARKYPNAYKYGKILTAHKFMNLGKTNENIIAAGSLCRPPDYTSTFGGFKAKILDPFSRNMEALQEIVPFEWNGEEPKTYKMFLRTSLSVKWIGYPENEEYISKRLHPTPQKKGKK